MSRPNRQPARDARVPLFRRIPTRAWICIGAAMLLQLIIFFPTRSLIARLPMHYMETPLDLAIPFIPGWITIYYLSFVSWLVSSVWILSGDRAHAYRFTSAYILALIASAVVFIAYPGTMHRPEPTGDGLFMRWMRQLYRIDSPMNLCPSLHVLLSYFCWRGTYGCRHIPPWYRWFNFVFLILVCLSILFVKQHVVVDIPVAILVGELALQAARVFRLERIPESLAARIHKH